MRWVLRKLGVDEWHIRTFMALYTEAYTDTGTSESFEVKVGLHQGSVLSPVLSPLLFLLSWMLCPVRREVVCLPSCCMLITNHETAFYTRSLMERTKD